MKNKILTKILILFLIIIFVMSIMGINKSRASVTIGGTTMRTESDLGAFAGSHPKEFIEAAASSLLYATLEDADSIPESSMNGKNGQCVSHTEANVTNSHAYYTICNVIDTVFNPTTGKYENQTYSAGGNVTSSAGDTAAQLAYAINELTTGNSSAGYNADSEAKYVFNNYWLESVNNGEIVPDPLIMGSGEGAAGRDGRQQTSTAAENFARTIGLIEKVGEGAEELLENNSHLGPFTLKFTGQIDSVSIDAGEGKSGSVQWSSDCSSWSSNFSKIPSGKAIYVKLYDGSKNVDLADCEKIIVTFSLKKQKFLKTRTVLLGSAGHYMQDMAIFASTEIEEDEFGGSVQSSVSYEINGGRGSITITKVDKATGKPIKSPLKAGFKLKIEKGGWVTGAAGGPHKYVEGDGTEYFTQNGVVTISGLKAGKSYHIYETTFPEGSDPSKQKVPKPGGGYFTTNKDTGMLMVAQSLKVEAGKNAEVGITVENVIGDGNISIRKEDNKDSSKGLVAGFTVYCPDYGYLTGEDGDYSFAESGGTTYHTDSEGNLSLSGLPYGTYTITEVEAPQGYEITEKTKSCSISKDAKSGTVTFKDKKGDGDGEITIYKYDKDHPSQGLSAGFKIYHSENGYITGAGGDIHYTNGSGVLTVSDLPYGDYTITEVNPPSGYRISEGSKTCSISKTHKSDSVKFYDEKNDDEGKGLQVLKIDSDGSGHPIEGVSFDLYRWEWDHDEYKYDILQRDLIKAGYHEQVRDENGNPVLNSSGDPTWVWIEPVYSDWYDGGSIGWVRKQYDDDLTEYYQTDSREIWEYHRVSSATSDGAGIAKFGVWSSIPKDSIPDNVDKKYGETYYIQETSNAVGYHDGTRNRIYFDIDPEEEDEIIEKKIENKKNKIIIEKKDQVTGEAMSGVQFKLYSGDKGVILTQDSPDGAYNYVGLGSPTVATTSGGKIVYGRMPEGTYKLEEIKTGKIYDLYVLNAAGDPYDGKEAGVTATISFGGREQTYDIYDKKKVSVSGKVWLDKQEGKNNDTNNVDDGEPGIPGVVVTLKDSTGKDPDVSATTSGDGSYKIEYAMDRYKVKNYYLEFNYSGISYKKCIPVQMSSGENGSKAMSDSIPYEDYKYSGHAYTNRNGSRLEEFYPDKKIDEIQNINLGLKQVPDTEYHVEENIEDVKIKMRGQEFTYKHGSPGNRDSATAPTVKFQSKGSVSAYTQPIYPSDIAYDVKNETEELKVDVRYRIDITNTTNYAIPNLYIEKWLIIDSLISNFDKNRYKLSDQEKSWRANGEDSASLASSFAIGPGQTGSIYITFSVKHDAILEILKNPDGIIENHPTGVTASGYHRYQRNDYTWPKSGLEWHRTENKSESATAPYLIFILGEKRILSGKVFEDEVDKEIKNKRGEILGNGQYDKNENIVRNVLVELLEKKDGSLSLAYTYDLNNGNNGEKVADKKEAKIYSNDNGEFQFTGVTPGECYVRFTYGDGTQKIYDMSKKFKQDVSSKDYKSTIVTDDAAANALGHDTNSHGEHWYQHLKDYNQSIAVDNLDKRKEANAKNDENENNNAIKGANLYAETAPFAIKIENIISNEANASSTSSNYLQNGIIDPTKENVYYKGFNFGIIKQPEQNVKLDKIITNIKLTNSQGNTIFDGNPGKIKMQGVTDLDGDKDNEGSWYTRIETAKENIYGSTLTLTYTIKVTNTSDVNYYGHNYYWFGDKRGCYEVTITPKIVTDYLDEKMVCLTTDTQDGKKVEVKKKMTDDNGRKISLLKIANKEESVPGWKTIYTNKKTPRASNKPTYDTVQIIAEKVLSEEDEDLEYINEAEILIGDAKRTPDIVEESVGGKLTGEIEDIIETIKSNVDSPDKPLAKNVLTPPTGENLQIYVTATIAAIVILTTLACGIIIIKKKQ